MRVEAFKRLALAAALIAVFLLTAPAAAKEVPFLSGRINDLAGMIPADTAGRIESKLAAFEDETGAQIAVLTIDSLEGDALEDYSMRVVETWKLGRAERDDGLLLLIARDDRKMRIEVGYGLEGRLTDLQSGRILNEILRPEFREGRFGEGIEQGVDAIIGTIQGDDPLPELTAVSESPMADESLIARLGFLAIPAFVIGIFSFTALFSKGGGSFFLYLFLMPFYFAFPSAVFGVRGGLIALGAWFVGYPIVKILLRYTAAGRRFSDAHPTWTSSSGGGWSSGGSSWSGGGGFSGGGGSFGGGGASSSW